MTGRAAPRILNLGLVVLAAVLVSDAIALADMDYESGQDTVFRHSQTSPFWVSGQINYLLEMNPHFPAQYSGSNSFQNSTDHGNTVVMTLYTGLQFTRTSEALLDVESAGGNPLSGALGLAGYTNEDAQRDPALAWTPYLARAELHQMIPLSDDTDSKERGPLSLLTTVSSRRIDIYVGEFSPVDFFDNNAVAGDDHMQFTNWAVVTTGSYDYACETRGYTWGSVLDFVDGWWTFRFGEFLNSKQANGVYFQTDLMKAHSENYELELDPALFSGRNTSIHFLGFTNFGNFGSYYQANSQYQSGITKIPDINNHPARVALKYGFAFNVEQDLTDDLRSFIRAGWSDGQKQTWEYAEIDKTVAFGADLRGTRWHRPRDKFGVAFVVNGLARDHHKYLALGGSGLNLGDGALDYGSEKIAEVYYNFPFPGLDGMFAAPDFQYFDNPGYNRARGPAVVFGLRVHIEL